MQLLVSVIIPTYNRPHLLKNCLHQLADQKIKKEEFEIIVVSDGPDENTQAIVRQCQLNGLTNISFYSLPNKKGPAAARNLGWRNAKGVMIAFTDDDCLPEPGWLQEILKNYNGERNIAYAGQIIVPVSDEPTDFELNTQGLETVSFATANCACTKASLEAIGGFDEQFTVAWREDTELEFKFLQRGIPIIKLNTAFVVHPVREAPWGVSIKEQRKNQFNALLYKKYPQLFRLRIKRQPTWKYYFILLFFILFVVGAVYAKPIIAIIAFACWLILTINFIRKRLAKTRKTKDHVIEMVATSIVIPFLSIYWTLYGAIKFRVLFF